jgi:hypothetical protein
MRRQQRRHIHWAGSRHSAGKSIKERGLQYVEHLVCGSDHSVFGFERRLAMINLAMEVVSYTA